jgi:DNA ligase-associated metallophosphoesterase
MRIEINGCAFTLLSQKALYKPGESLLIVADVHLGKANHFRKSGIPMPAIAQQDDYERLEKLFDQVKPEKVYFLGDLFHSTLNNDWRNFCELIAKFPSILFILVKGNHDLIDEGLFKDICIDVVDLIEDESFVYSHAPMEMVPEGKVNIVGHIHPGVVLSGLARQSIKLPCFYMCESLLILPAFGILTGLYSMEQSRDATIYVVTEGGVKVIAPNPSR